jgi:putative membrane protein
MQNRLVIFVSGAVLALGACGRHDEATDNTAADMNVAIDNGVVVDNGMVANDAAVAPSPLTAQGFANTAAASDRFEIESSKLAEASASSAAVKKFAAQMIKAHTESTAKLKSTLSGLSPAITPDDTLTPEQQATLDSLKAAKGAAFDTAYALAQVDAHQKTLDALKNYAASGDNEQLKTFANGLVPTVTAHLNMAKGLK